MQDRERTPALMEEVHVDQISWAEYTNDDAKEARKVPRYQVRDVIIRAGHQRRPDLGSQLPKHGPEDDRGTAILVGKRPPEEATSG